MHNLQFMASETVVSSLRFEPAPKNHSDQAESFQFPKRKGQTPLSKYAPIAFEQGQDRKNQIETLRSIIKTYEIRFQESQRNEQQQTKIIEGLRAKLKQEQIATQEYESQLAQSQGHISYLEGVISEYSKRILQIGSLGNEKEQEKKMQEKEKALAAAYEQKIADLQRQCLNISKKNEGLENRLQEIAMISKQPPLRGRGNVQLCKEASQHHIRLAKEEIVSSQRKLVEALKKMEQIQKIWQI